MNIKLVVSDMDGTLLNDKKEKPAEFDEWVRNHPDVKVAIASGRQYYTLVNDFESIKDQLIYLSENGGLIWERGEIIYADEVKKEDVYHTLRILEEIPEADVVLCGARSAYIRPSSPAIMKDAHMYYKRLLIVDNLEDYVENDMIIKLALFFENKDAEECFKRITDLPDTLTKALSGDAYIDIMNTTVNKGSAINKVQELYGIAREESMGFGDYLNDYEMLLACEESYCMVNGHQKLKSIAKHIAPSNEEEGVMQILRTISST